MELRPFTRADLPGLLAVQHATAGSEPRWSAALIEAQLYDPMRGGGSQVVVAERRGEVAGGVGWVAAGREFYAAPLLALDEETAAQLIDHAIGQARSSGAAWLRCSSNAGQPANAAALAARGFRAALDFITTARPSAPGEPAAGRVPLGDVDRAPLVELHNDTFRGVPNSPPLGAADLEHLLAAHWPPGSGVWGDGFLVALLDDDERGRFAAVDAVGVREAARGRGLGRIMIGHLIAEAARAGIPEVRATIASTNTASLALHLGCGFAEIHRRTTWQLDLLPE